MKRIKKNDTVIITTGKSKNHIGKVLRVLGQKLVVEGANLMKKHVKPNPQLQQAGGIVTLEAALDCSNVAMYNPQTKKRIKLALNTLKKTANLIRFAILSPIKN